MKSKLQPELNPRTLVTVHGYAGDQHQVRAALPLYEHHRCPVVIFAPEDSPIKVMGPHITRAVGKRAYIGPDSLIRQKFHLQAMLEYEFDFFLANDSDSVCLSPTIPQYLYNEPDVLWSNEVSDMMHVRPASYSWPRLAFQPPYFMSRQVIEKLLSVADDVEPEPQTPFIDWVMMAWAVAAGCPHKNYRDGVSCPSTNPEGLNLMRHMVRHEGRVMIHSVKSAYVLSRLVNDRKLFLKRP